MEENIVLTEKKGITGSTLKIIAIVAMFIDHFAAIILTGIIKNSYPVDGSMENAVQWLSEHALLYYGNVGLRMIGRFGFPIFAFLLVEGFTHTRNVGKYIRNLAIFAIVSELPFNVGFSGYLFYPEYQNVFFTLGLGVCCLFCIKKFAEEKNWSNKLSFLFYPMSLVLGGGFMYGFVNTEFGSLIPQNVHLYIIGAGAVIFLVVMIIIGRKWDLATKNRYAFTVLFLAVFFEIADLLMTDYGGWGVAVIVIMYLLRTNKMKAFGWGCALLTIMSPIEVTAFLMMIPISKYNGKRGISLKYFFYAFYPAHILILYLIGLVAGVTSFALRM